MDFDNLDELYTRIVTGVSVIEFRDKLYLVKDPTPKEKKLADHWYRKCQDRFLFSSALTTEEVDNLILDRKLIDPGLVSNLEEIEDYISDLKEKKILSSKEKQEVDLFERKKKELDRVKSSLTNKTADYLATIEKYKYLVFLCTYDELEERVWLRHQDFLKEDEKLVNHLLSEAFFNFNLPEKSLRKIARTEPWRSTWITYCKGGGNLFDNPTLSFMTDLQRALVSWSIIYDGIYENPERPSADIIEDDDRCDEWLKSQHKESKKTKRKINNKINSSQEIFVMVNSPEEAKRVYEDNDSSSKSLLRHRSNKIQQSGKVKEGHLPDVQVDLKLRRNRLQMTKGKKK